MANLDRSFDIVGPMTPQHEESIQKALGSLDGVNHVRCDAVEKKIIVGYTPGIINVQNIKEVIEGHGLDVSEMGDD